MYVKIMRKSKYSNFVDVYDINITLVPHSYKCVHCCCIYCSLNIVYLCIHTYIKMVCLLLAKHCLLVYTYLYKNGVSIAC